jgi:hypothetical protein
MLFIVAFGVLFTYQVSVGFLSEKSSITKGEKVAGSHWEETENASTSKSSDYAKGNISNASLQTQVAHFSQSEGQWGKQETLLNKQIKEAAHSEKGTQIVLNQSKEDLFKSDSDW